MNQRLMSKSRVICVAALLIGQKGTGIAQPEFLRISGGINLSSEIYSSHGGPSRRGARVARAIFTPTITLFEQVTLPFEFYISTEDRGFHQPFNQFGVNPRLTDWLTLHGGYFSSSLSEFTFGDSRVLGGGIDLTPGPFRLSVLYGISQQRVQSDTLINIVGKYERRVMGIKLGVGSKGGPMFHLNAVRSFDDSSSLVNPKVGIASDSIVSLYQVAPKENLVVSGEFGLPLWGRELYLSGEVAASGYSSDTRMEKVGSVPSWVGSFFTPRLSSSVDGAVSASLNINLIDAFSLRLNGKWVGPGYVTLGYEQLPNDVLDWTIAPTARLLDGRLQLSGSFGIRRNNLRHNRVATTERAIVNSSVSYQVSSGFGLDAQFANYGLSILHKRDSLRVKSISRSFSLTPRFSFSAIEASHVTSCTYSFQDISDGVSSMASNNNRTHTLSTLWSMTFPSTWYVNTSSVLTRTSLGAVSTSVLGIHEGIGRQFFDGALTGEVNAGYTRVSSQTIERQITGGISVTYRIEGLGTLSLALAINSVSFDPDDPRPPSSERQASLRYSYSF